MGLFVATGRFAARFRWAVVVAWLGAAVLAHLFFPSLASRGSPGSRHLGVPIVGGDGQHHTVVALAADGYQVFIF